MGFAAPATGWAGAGLALAMPPTAATVLLQLRAANRRAILVALTLGLALAGVLLQHTASSPQHAGIRAETTAWGALQGSDAVLQRVERMAAAAPPNTTTHVWPESILGRYEPALEPVLEVELLRAAQQAGRTLVIGLDLPADDGRLLNAAVAFRPDGSRSAAIARQPAPLALWRPWRRADGFIADWGADNMLELPGGERAAVIFCYEEYIPLLYLLNEARDAPPLYLVLANAWAARHPSATSIQTLHSLGMARLFGRPYLKAENRPQP